MSVHSTGTADPVAHEAGGPDRAAGPLTVLVGPEPPDEAPTVVLVAHDGGVRAGHVTALPAHLLRGHLVYDGPQWLGVYQRSSPLRTVPTEQGDAEVWTTLG